MNQGSELPSRREPQAGVPEAIPAAADVETPGTEAADAHANAVRVETRRTNVDALEQTDTTGQEVGRDEPGHLGSVRHVGGSIGEQGHLFGPVLVQRTRDRVLADDQPPEGDLVVPAEHLLRLRVPAVLLRVEVVGLESTDVEQGQGRRGAGDHDVIIRLAPVQDLDRRNGFRQLLNVLVGVDDRRTHDHDLLGRDEVVAEDRPSGAVVRRLGREAGDAVHHIRDELSPTREQTRAAALVETGDLGHDRGRKQMQFALPCTRQIVGIRSRGHW